MKNNWFITKEHDINLINYFSIKFNSYTFHFQNESNLQQVNNKLKMIYIEGFLLPKQSYFEDYKYVEQFKLIERLFDIYGHNFINYIKGNFIIILFFDNEFIIFNDKIGIRKIFYYENNDFLWVSNHVSTLRKTFLEVDNNSIILNSLFHHFIDGRTIFKNIFYSKPATKLLFRNNLQIDYYWNINNLLKLKKNSYNLIDIAENFSTLLKHYITYLKYDGISMTLTGGFDTRTILAGLLNIGINPKCYTFGNELSGDSQNAKMLANKLNLEFNNYDVTKINVSDYDSYVNSVIENQSTLAHLHRAHRLAAFEMHYEKRSRNELLFVGSMGGEAVRGIHLEDLVISKFARFTIFEDIKVESIIDQYLHEYFIDFKNFDKKYILSVIDNLPYYSNNLKINEFLILYLLTASLHDAQDINIYNLGGVKCIPMFLDDDYLEMIFSSSYSMINKNNYSKNQFKRLNIPEFNCNIINILMPELSKHQFVNGFSPNEYLTNRIYYLILRATRHYFQKSNYQPNFPYRNWFKKYVSDNFMNLEKEINQIFNLDDAIHRLQNSAYEFDEKYWQKYSNIIMYDKIIKRYLL